MTYPFEHPEFERLAKAKERTEHWRRWGSYLSERQWGTVREDYSEDGSCWQYFSYEDAMARAFRWGEDGLLGLSDRRCRLCFSVAYWNEKDPFLKERLFGLTGPEGNHGEDVKELYYYLAALPSHAYQRALYKYPQNEFPYQLLRQKNRELGKDVSEFELVDTGIFDQNEYFDCYVEYAKKSSNDILIQLTIENKAPTAAPLHVLPTLWFRNAWSWGRRGEGYWDRPSIEATSDTAMLTKHEMLGSYQFSADTANGTATQLFTENETNHKKLFGFDNASPYVKDSFHQYVVHGDTDAVNPNLIGSKASFYYQQSLAPGEKKILRFRLSSIDERPDVFFGEDFTDTLNLRCEETESFYGELHKGDFDPQTHAIITQSYGGLVWSKQFYWYGVKEWIEGDPDQPQPSPSRKKSGRNKSWEHLYNRDVISMPDKWEYPWYAAWDLAFHMIPFCRIDPDFAKDQLILMLREWYMHPNGQIPAYEFAFSDVNPPVHAWACWRVYKMSAQGGKRDRVFLARVFQKLLVNFTWWVNRKDISGRNLFSGGFLGLDNIGVFDRSNPPPVGHYLEQADATAWMAFYCGTMLSMAVELAQEDPAYEDVASKFFEHFIHIADAMNTLGGSGLWEDEDGFYFDLLHLDDDKTQYLKVRSLVGIIPLFAAEVFEEETVNRLPGFKARSEWFLRNRRDLTKYVSYMQRSGQRRQGLALLALPSQERLVRLLKRILDENEFLSPFGVRSLSKAHENDPYILKDGDKTHTVTYTPGESRTGMFGGNSNWRGPIWFPLNFLLIESLERYYHFYGKDFKVECPTGSGNFMNLRDVSLEIAGRLSSLFYPDKNGLRPAHGKDSLHSTNAEWHDLVLFYEHFHGDTGRGLGASHQTGWTALVAQCIEKLNKKDQLDTYITRMAES